MATLPLLGDEERARLAAPPRLDFGPVEGTLHGRFAEQVRLRGDAVAVSDDSSRLDYGELDARANRIAGVLQARGVEAGAIVGVMLERGVDLVAGILAVLKCGAAYLPIDPENPAARTGHQLTDCAATTILVSPDLVDRLPEEATSVTVLDWQAAAFAEAAGQPVGVAVGAAAPAYVIYTSGSTGAPKGVIVSHANVLRLLDAAPSTCSTSAPTTCGPCSTRTRSTSRCGSCGARCCTAGGSSSSRTGSPARPTCSPSSSSEEGVTVLNQTPSAFGQLIARDAGVAPRRGWRCATSSSAARRSIAPRCAPGSPRNGDERPAADQHVRDHRDHGARHLPPGDRAPTSIAGSR